MVCVTRLFFFLTKQNQYPEKENCIRVEVRVTEIHSKNK